MEEFAEEKVKDLTEEEHISIANYKEYQKRHLPNVSALKDLYAADFDSDAYPDRDFVDGLRKYLDKLKPYTQHIARAAYLRQAHYEQHIRGVKEEEPGHTAWREGMNSLAEDCSEKLEYWSQVYRDKLNEIFDRAVERKVHYIDLTTRNCDVSFYRTEMNTDGSKRVDTQKVQKLQKQKIYRPPKISARERARLNQQYREQLLAKSRAEHKMLDAEMDKNAAYHQRIASYEVHKICNAIEVPIRDIYDIILRKGMDSPLTCTDFMLDFPCGIIPVGEGMEMVDLTLLLYSAISQINDQFCIYYKCDLSDCNSATDCKHNCDKGNIGDEIPAPLQVCCHKLDAVVNLICCINQISPHAELTILTLLNCVLIDYRMAWNSYVTGVVMSMILSKMDDDAIIANIKSAIQKLTNLREKIRIISRMDIPTETASSAIKTAFGYYHRLNRYALTLSQLYPIALYHDRILFMRRLIAENDVVYGSKLTRHGDLFIDPPVINYAKIKRETGLIMSAPKHIIDTYNSVRREYNKLLHSELKKLTSGNASRK